ncbi:MAG: hypothetical protein LRY73_04215 [Bacillus sp. (in: Bacteria)]|nr:hypothetical protein [Bacillus sp. (in: firmicutes)]
MAYVMINKEKKEYIIHEQRDCTDLERIDVKDSNYEFLTFRDLRRAKYYCLTHFDDYKIIHHCRETVKAFSGSRNADAPFNDYIQHHQNVIGPVGKRVNIQGLPKWLRYFYYGVVVSVVTFILFGIYISIFH